MKIKYKKRWPNGNLRETGFLKKNGDIHGVVTKYNEDGEPIEKVEYKKGIEIGKMKRKYQKRWPNGNLKETGFLKKNGNIHGVVTKYTEDGKPKEKIEYKKGIEIGNIFKNLSCDEILEKLSTKADIDTEEDITDDDTIEEETIVDAEGISLLYYAEDEEIF